MNGNTIVIVYCKKSLLERIFTPNIRFPLDGLVDIGVFLECKGSKYLTATNEHICNRSHTPLEIISILYFSYHLSDKILRTR